jgi:hypothetical protein
MSRENEIRMPTLHDTNHKHQSSGENLDPELYQLQIQLAAIQEQQRLQTFMIKQFEQQLKFYRNKQQYTQQGRTKSNDWNVRFLFPY